MYFEVTNETLASFTIAELCFLAHMIDSLTFTLLFLNVKGFMIDIPLVQIM